MDRRWKGSADKELREVLKFFRWQPAISLQPMWTQASRGWNLVSTNRLPGGTSGKEPACQCRRHERRGFSLGREDPLQEDAATHSGILAWRIPWTEGPGRLQSIGLQRVGHNWSDLTDTHTLSHIALLTGTKKELRFMFNFCFSCFLICSCILLDSLRYPLLHYFQELLDNLPQILFAPPDALNLLVRGDPASLVTMVTDPHSFPWISGSSTLKWKSGFRWFLLLLLFLKISTELVQTETSAILRLTENDRMGGPGRDLRCHWGQPSHFIDEGRLRACILSCCSYVQLWSYRP